MQHRYCTYVPGSATWPNENTAEIAKRKSAELYIVYVSREFILLRQNKFPFALDVDSLVLLFL